MRSIAGKLATVVIALSACRPSTAPRPALNERAALRQFVDSLLDAPEIRQARLGVLVVDALAGDTLVSRDAGKLFVPASNMKLITAAVALDVLGPDFRFATPIVARGDVQQGVLAGDLLVIGRGDPSVSDNMAGDAMVPLRAMADSLWERGLRRVRGHVVAYGNAFPDANAGAGWSWDDFEEPYGALIDELLFNEGFSELHVTGGDTAGAPATVRASPARTVPRVRLDVITVARTATDSAAHLRVAKDTLHGDVVVSGTIPARVVDTVFATHPDPDGAYVAALTEALRDRGIVVSDSSVPASSRMDTLFVRRAPPLSAILAYFLKPSQNQVGEMLFKSVALARTDTGTANSARRVVAERLRAWGARPDGFVVQDGSGLSRMDLVSPETIVHVLDAMRHASTFGLYHDALPVAGFDGTLRTRMRGTRAEANVRGKTGTLSAVRSLSGYVTTRSGRLLLFSILCNNYVVPTSAITRIQDSIAARLADLSYTMPFPAARSDVLTNGGRP
jgi:D-alanyl-D-alanine carboxypeptidase/D-alanyl-D-alanine-endopeptidase (penicillin-binding protein 4)